MKGFLNKFKANVLNYNSIFEDNTKLEIAQKFPHVDDNFVSKIREVAKNLQDYTRSHLYNFMKLIIVRVCRPEFVTRSNKYVLEEF